MSYRTMTPGDVRQALDRIDAVLGERLVPAARELERMTTDDPFSASRAAKWLWKDLEVSATVLAENFESLLAAMRGEGGGVQGS